jgi:hypothetical protein
MAAPARFAAKMTAGVFTAPVAGMLLPDRVYLVGEFLLGGTQAESIRNRANPAVPMTVQTGVEGPVYNAHSVTVRSHGTAGYGFLTNILPDENYTMIVVRKNAAIATTVKIAGQASTNFWGPRQSAADNYFNTGEGASNTGAKRAKPSSAAEIYFEAGVHQARNPQLLTGGLGKMYYYSSGGVQQEVLSDTVVNLARNFYAQICIGSTFLTDTRPDNTIEVFFVAIYNKPLTPTQIDTAHAAIVAYYATLGVTVV